MLEAPWKQAKLNVAYFGIIQFSWGSGSKMFSFRKFSKAAFGNSDICQHFK